MLRNGASRSWPRSRSPWPRSTAARKGSCATLSTVADRSACTCSSERPRGSTKREPSPIQEASMKVRELLDVLRDYPAELEVELVVVCPVDRPGDPVEVDRYSVGAVLTWQDADES